MSASLEDRLSQHLHARADTELAEPTGLTDVQRIAKGRSLRTRAALGVASLAVIAGLASFIPTGDEPSALITAQQPAEEEEDDAEVEEPTDQSAVPSRIPIGPPPNRRIGTDGQGGFAAVMSSTDGLTFFVRSDDGENWYEAGEWRHDEDVSVVKMRYVDGHYVAVLDQPQVPGSVAVDLIRPQVAISSDLTDWQFIELSLPNPDASLRFRFEDIAAVGDDLMFSVVEYDDPSSIEIDNTIRGEMCGISTTPTTSTITLCTGEIIESPGLPEVRPRQRLLLSEGGGPAIEQELPDDGTPFPLEVFVADGVLRYESLYTELDPALAEQIRWPTDQERPIALPELWNVSYNERGQQLLLLRDHADDHVDSGRGVWTALLPEGTIGQLPEEVSIPLGFIPLQVASGPSGWAMMLDTTPSGVIRIERESWEVTGQPAFGSFTVTSQGDEFEQHSYRSSPVAIPPYLQWSLFGEVRLFRPGTDELLVELTSQETRNSYAAFTGFAPDLPEPAAFDRELTVDGWTLSGDPLRGPLYLRSPAGESQTFDDGFAFTNDDTSDGVEIDLPTGTSSVSHYNYRTQPMQFFDQDQLLVEFEMRAIHNALIEPLFADVELDAAPAIPSQRPQGTGTWLLYSPNGVDWEVIAQPRVFTVLSDIELALGEDEVVVIRTDWPGPQRFELPAAED